MEYTFKIKHNIGNLIDKIDKLVIKNNDLTIYYSEIKDKKQTMIEVTKTSHDEIIVGFDHCQNEIKSHYVDFTTAKWLKEKGFKGIEIDYGLNQMLNNSNPPQQLQVVEWLRINHGIWTSVDKQNYKLFKWRISNINLRNDAISDSIEKSGFNYDSPQEAYLAAFDYIRLNNLI